MGLVYVVELKQDKKHLAINQNRATYRALEESARHQWSPSAPLLTYPPP